MKIKQLIILVSILHYTKDIYSQFNFPIFKDSTAILKLRNDYDDYYSEFVFRGIGHNNIENKDGIWKYYDDNNIKRIEGNYVHNKKEGIWTLYYSNGRIQVVGKYSDNKPDSIWAGYFKNGKTNWIGNYKDSLMQGKWIFHFSNEILAGVGNYVNGNGSNIGSTGIPMSGRDGNWLLYYSNGNLRENQNWKKNYLFGKYLSYYESGKIKSIYNYTTDGKKDSIQTSYYENGELKSIQNFKDESLVGKQYFYYESGKIKTLTNYTNKSEKDSTQIEYYENGKIKSIENYFEGKSEGEKREYNQLGYLLYQANYKNNKLNGIEKTWYYHEPYYRQTAITITTENIQAKQSDEVYFLKTFANYKNGLRDSIFAEYYFNGKKKIEIYYENNKINGTKKEWNENGTLKEMTTYLNDKKNGIHQIFDDSGFLTKNEIYKDGSLNGKYIEYWNKDQLKETTTYKEGNQIGKSVLYYKNGKINSESNYSDNGNLDGLFAIYDEKGTLIKKSNFKNDVLNGDYEEYNELDYSLVEKGKYVNGKKEGLWKMEVNFDIVKDNDITDDNDTTILLLNYKNDAIIGNANVYYTSGELCSTGKLQDVNFPTGLWTVYYKDGSKKCVIEYPSRELLLSPNKYWNYWDKNKNQTVKDGNGIITLYYPNNKPYASYNISNGLISIWNTYDTLGLLVKCGIFVTNEYTTLTYPDDIGIVSKEYENEFKSLKQIYTTFYLQYFDKLKWKNINLDFNIVGDSVNNKDMLSEFSYTYRIWNIKGELLSQGIDESLESNFLKDKKFFFNTIYVKDIKPYIAVNKPIFIRLKDKKFFKENPNADFYVLIYIKE